MNLQQMIDGMIVEWQRERASSQMTLGKLITILGEMPPETKVVNLHDPHSYRGYYCDFAFERGEGTITAAELLTECKEAMGQVFMGYKGGDYVMGAKTPVWIANYGCSGEKLMALGADGSIETKQDD